MQESAIVNFHYDVIEPYKKILTYVHFRNVVLLEKSIWDVVFQTNHNINN